MTPAYAISLAIVSAFCFALAEITVRNALRFASLITTAILTLAIQCLLLTTVNLITGQFSNLNWEGVLWFLLAGFLNPFLFVTLYFFAIQRIGVTRSAPIKGSAPIFAVIIAVGMLGERLAAIQFLGIALVIGGILFISAEGWMRRRAGSFTSQASPGSGSEPSGNPRAKLDYLLPLFAGMAAGVASIFFKLGMQKMPSPLVGAWIGTVVGLPLLPLIAFFFPRYQRYRASPSAFPWLLATGVTIVAAMYTYIYSIGLGQVSIVFTLVQTSPLFVIGLSVLFLRQLERVTPRVVIGAVLTVGGGVLVSLF